MARPNRDDEHLRKLQDYYARSRALPSYASISTLLGFRTKGAVAALAGRLCDAGYLTQLPDGRLAPGKRFFERPQASSLVPAGFPSPATDDLKDTISIDQDIVRFPSRTVLVTVKGDSMVDAGILPGDVAVVERRNTAGDGEIVVAIVEGEFTIKRLVKERGRFVLKPENKAYPILRPKELEIYGVIVGSYRKYR